jgi:hypothetical protein
MWQPKQPCQFSLLWFSGKSFILHQRLGNTWQSSSNLSWDMSFCGFPQHQQINAGLIPEIRPQPLPSTSFTIHYHLVIWCYTVQTVPLNKVQHEVQKYADSVFAWLFTMRCLNKTIKFSAITQSVVTWFLKIAVFRDVMACSLLDYYQSNLPPSSGYFNALSDCMESHPRRQ